jgi:sugar phosphate isomerase/epimerase
MANSLLTSEHISRRQFCGIAAGTAAATFAGPTAFRALAEPGNPSKFKLNYIVSAAMYGTAPLESVLADVKKAGADTVDIWPQPHGNHREQIDQLGLDQTEALLKQFGIRWGASTRYDLAPSKLGDELRILKRFGAKVLVTGASSPDKDSVKEQVRKFVESMKAPVEVAESCAVKIGIENHISSILNTPEAVRYFADFSKSPNLGLAMAPYHLPQDPEVITKLITDLGEKIVFFQAWEYGMGCMEKLPKEQELMQMPGRGKLDFVPIVAALQKINYAGWTEIFMHPTPRGIPIRETTPEVTAEINRSRDYLDSCLAKASSL